MENRKLRIALTKGRIEEKAVSLLEKIGYDVTDLREKGRRLILSIPNEDIEVVLAKAADVITYVDTAGDSTKYPILISENADLRLP